MSNETKSDELVVKAGSVTVLRLVGAGKAWVDVAQGEPVGDLDDETRERLLASGAIGKRDDGAYVPVARPVAGEVEPDEIPAGLLPGGSVEGILAWVGDDLARARVAREMEEAKGPKARANLLKALDEVKVSVETEPPAVPESYDGTVQPAPAGGVVTPVDDSAVDGKTASEAPASKRTRS
ncbi:hypothetical protein [Actinoplanes palleronii]|uniref:Uncharacterized protein n=1 Tax=Actinoplanes palleronii TaxID=113570 RepID=A0ABQ4BJE0_9ACTN|nr:hypothetical protein [Actinoplanes palleronii]GIE70740.1 hypothetical protein Apa02nite_068480 [Actinoplanes palleronii]